MIFLMVEKGCTGIDDDGVWFEGTEDQFCDCFGSVANISEIYAFAADNGSFIMEIENDVS